MKKGTMALALAATMLLGAFAVGCDSSDKNGGTDMEQGETNTDQGGNGAEQPEERKLRVLAPDFSYEVQTADYKVQYDEFEIYGKLYTPISKEKKKFPLVVMSHGFNGHANDFDKEGNRFASRGYVAYSLEFCGAQVNGKSTGRDANTYTPLTMKQDIIAVVDRLKKLSIVDETQIFLFGGSQGGFVTALAAADDALKDTVSAVAMYFPAFNIPDDWHGKPEQLTELMGYYIGAEYIKSVQDLDPYAIIGNFKKDVCIVWGDRDALVKRQYIDRAVQTYGADRAKLTVIEGAGHGFGGEALNTAVETVLTFLEKRTYE